MSTRSVAPTREAPVPVLTSVRRPMLQRSCDCGQHTGGGECAECKKKHLALQRHRDESQFPAVAPPIVHDVLRSPGQPLDAGTRAIMEPRFAQDFSHVRVHSDAQAAESARAVNATAYTVGKKIVFGESQYQPGTSSGKKLLAHELTHVVQQSRQESASRHALSIGPTDDLLEREASSSADRIVESGSSALAGGITSPTLQRQAGNQPAPKGNPTHALASQAEEPITLPQTHSTGNYGLGIFQSELRTFSGFGSPCLLTLSLRLHFDFQDAPPPAPVTRKKWSAAEQNSWTNAFVRSVTSRWSYQYPLIPGDRKKCALWQAAVCDRAMARVEVIPVITDAHADVVVYHAGSGYRSGAGYGRGYLTQEDVQPAETGHGVQVAAEHEFGHLLGLDHSNPACQSTAAGPAQNPGRPGCYVGTPEQTADIMGSGSIVTPPDYTPFVEEMNHYSFGGCGWKVEGSAPKPPSKSFLAGHAGLATGALLGAAGGAIGGALLGAPLGGGTAAGMGVALGLVGGVVGAGIGALADWIAS